MMRHGWADAPSFVTRPRQRLLREKIGNTLATDDTIREEIPHLLRALKT